WGLPSPEGVLVCERPERDTLGRSRGAEAPLLHRITPVRGSQSVEAGGVDEPDLDALGVRREVEPLAVGREAADGSAAVDPHFGANRAGRRVEAANAVDAGSGDADQHQAVLDAHGDAVRPLDGLADRP